jgi:NADH-quinone oxidoreductase subunit N
MSPYGPVDLRPVWPALIIALTGVVVLAAQALTPRARRGPFAALSLVGIVAALVSVVMIANGRGRGVVMGGVVAADDFSLFFHALLLGIAAVVVLLSPSYLRATGAERGEYYALVLFSLVGMLGLVSCRELVALFVALEIMSVALYALAGLHRERPESQESAMKYFITGAFSSAFFLYGVALLYGVSGSTSLARIAPAVRAADGGAALMAIVGAGLLLVGFGFKVASVPFHMWAPDVYEGAPTTVTALMSAGVKTAAFGAFLRVFLQALPSLAADWQPAVAALAVVTMIVGNLGALAQTSIKRMLAYSSVGHAGYLLAAFVASPGVGTEAVLAALARNGREPRLFGDMAGLARRRPLLAAALTVFLISLTGIPVSAGFVGKFYLFTAAVDGGYVTLAIVGVLMSVVSAYYYLGVVVSMYMREPVGEDAWSPVAAPAGVALGVSVLVVLGLGVYPAPVLAWARLAARSLL